MKKKNNSELDINKYDELSNEGNSSYLYYGSGSKDVSRKIKKKHSNPRENMRWGYGLRVNALNELYCTLILITAVAVFVLGLKAYVISQAVVDGSSMQNTLMDGDHIFFEKISYRFEDPKRYDVIIFYPYVDSDSLYIKRVIGLPGEKVRIQDNVIYINDKAIDYNYSDCDFIEPGIAAKDVLLGKDEYFVLGDNTDVSLDSRDGKVGTIKRSSVIGKAFVDVWPLKNAKIIHDK